MSGRTQKTNQRDWLVRVDSVAIDAEVTVEHLRKTHRRIEKMLERAEKLGAFEGRADRAVKALSMAAQWLSQSDFENARARLAARSLVVDQTELNAELRGAGLAREEYERFGAPEARSNGGGWSSFRDRNDYRY